MPREVDRVTYFTGYLVETMKLDDDGNVLAIEVTEQDQDDVHEVYYMTPPHGERLDSEKDELDQKYFDFFFD